MVSLTFIIAFGIICLLSIDNQVGGHPVNVELTENDSESQNYKDEISEADPLNVPPAAELEEEESKDDSEELDSKPDIDIDTDSEARNVNDDNEGQEGETENGENKYQDSFGGEEAVEDGQNKRVKRQEIQSCEAPSAYDEDMERYEGVFGGYPQDVGVHRVKRSHWYK